MINNLIAFRGLKRSWRYCVEDTLVDILKSFAPAVEAGEQKIDFLFVSYDSEEFSEEDKQLIIRIIGGKHQVFWHTIPEPHVKVGGYLTIGYGGWQVNRWKIRQEVESKQPYDRVFETRYDTIKRFLPSSWVHLVNFMPSEFHVYVDLKDYKTDSMLPVVLNDFTILTTGSTHDIWGYSYMKNSDSMMKLADIYDTTTGFNSRFGAGEGWGIVYRKSGLVIDEHPMRVPFILRTEQFEYHPVLYIPEDSIDAALGVVEPKLHYSDALGEKAFMVSHMFADDKIATENAKLPALIVQMINYYRMDLHTWPKDFTILCSPKDKQTIKDLIKVAKLPGKIKVVSELTVDEPIALLSGVDIWSNQIYRYNLRFDSVNNIEMNQAHPDILLFGGEGSPRDNEELIPHNSKDSFIRFGEASIWKVNPPEITKFTNWSGSALIRKGINKIVYNNLPNFEGLRKGIMILPKIKNDLNWKKYEKAYSHRYNVYHFNSLTLLHIADPEIAEDVFAVISKQLSSVTISGQFISWNCDYKYNEEDTILRFVDAVVP